MKIIYTNNEGGVSVIIPTGELSIEEVAAKDIPEGVAYEIVEDDAIPAEVKNYEQNHLSKLTRRYYSPYKYSKHVMK